MTAGIGHNSGRVEERGKSWRTHVWAKARRELMPRLPIEIVRRRVARAKELGLPYKAYAGFRAACGDDLIGFMFSSNALDVVRAADQVPALKCNKIKGLKDAVAVGLAHPPIAPSQLVPPMASAYRAPRLSAPWVTVRDDLRLTFRDLGKPASRFVLVCDTALEAEWAEAAHMAGTLRSAQYFGAST